MNIWGYWNICKQMAHGDKSDLFNLLFISSLQQLFVAVHIKSSAAARCCSFFSRAHAASFRQSGLFVRVYWSILSLIKLSINPQKRNKIGQIFEKHVNIKLISCVLYFIEMCWKCRYYFVKHDYCILKVSMNCCFNILHMFTYVLHMFTYLHMFMYKRSIIRIYGGWGGCM
jgi:hypothetical protein